MIEIYLEKFYADTAKLTDLPSYIQRALEIAGEGNDVILTGRAPVWLYLKIGCPTWKGKKTCIQVTSNRRCINIRSQSF